MTREDAIDELSVLYERCIKARQFPNKFYCSLTDGQYIGALDMAIEALEQTRWIPVSERLPESDDEVLVTDDAGGLALVGIDWFDSDSNRWWCLQNVTAWMPLPEPYRGGDTDV